MSIYVSLVVSQIIVIMLQNRGWFFGILYDIIFPVTCVLLIYDSLGSRVHYLNPEDIDPALIRLDYLIFQGHPTIMLERFMNPLLTDLLQLAYTTYYFIPIIFAVTLRLNNQRKEFDRTLFLVLFCFYLSYLGYILMPAIGPRFTINHLQTSELQGLFVAEPIQNLLNQIQGIKRDAFPSGHTAIALLVLYLACKFKKRFFFILLPVVTALVFSTVYCRYHYVVDIFAGFGLTFLTILLGEWYYERRLKWFQENGRGERI